MNEKVNYFGPEVGGSELEEVSVLITGVSRGFGKAAAAEALRRKMTVYGVARSNDACRDLIDAGMKFICADLRFDSAVQNIRQTLDGKGLDILISNAGIPGGAMSLEDLTSEELLELLQVHVFGAMRATKGCFPALKAGKGQKLIYVTSRLGSTSLQFERAFEHLRTSYSYRIAKASLNMLAACVSVEMAEAQVIAVHPGRLKTDSAHSDANLEPAVAAQKLFDLIGMIGPQAKPEILNLDGESFPF